MAASSTGEGGLIGEEGTRGRRVQRLETKETRGTAAEPCGVGNSASGEQRGLTHIRTLASEGMHLDFFNLEKLNRRQQHFLIRQRKENLRNFMGQSIYDL